MNPDEILHEVDGGFEYHCPHCGMSGEVRDCPVLAGEDYIEHRSDQCIGPVVQGGAS